MAFYTIAHLITDAEEKELDEKFFDYVFYGKGKAPEGKMGKIAKEGRESFLYWYPLDSRNSGADLVRNHLPFFILNHVALFPEEHWPKQIVTNGFVLMDGKKMSKSMGNILPLRKAIAEYGADIIRFSVVGGADLTQDTDFNRTVAEGTRTRLDYIFGLVSEAAKEKKGKAKRIDKWLLSRLNRKIKDAPALYEKIALRELALSLFYEVYADLQWYEKRKGKDEIQLHDFFRKWTVLFAPFMPHYAEEFWHTLGGKGLVVNEEFPEANEKAIDESIERGEEVVQKAKDDIANLQKLLNMKPKKISIFVANKTKGRIYDLIAAEKAFDKVMKAASADSELKKHMDVVQRMTKSLIKNAYSMGKALPADEELEALKEAEKFFANEFRCEVSVVSEDGAKHDKAKNALPGKPSIVFE
jgi:leucyl-tRNA synthetase